MSDTTTGGNCRPRRKAAIEAAKHVREILEWECLPENSAKFQLIAAEFDKQFEAERESKLVNDGDLEDDDTSNLPAVGSDVDMSDDDEEMNEDDLNFIEKDSDYNESDATFVLSDAESCNYSSDNNAEETGKPNLTLEEELLDCLDVHAETVTLNDSSTLETETDLFLNDTDVDTENAM